ncbi:hypothetical protein [uncultured Draconibacterium sp.]|uniref:hypothetical protein n=1 Tax=uncultured Draconibacterium sp. TaxID=1573823 RepID=UPI0032612811
MASSLLATVKLWISPGVPVSLSYPIRSCSPSRLLLCCQGWQNLQSNPPSTALSTEMLNVMVSPSSTADGV